MTKQCKSCGAEIDVAAKYCKYCGASDDTYAAPEVKSQVTTADVLSAGAAAGSSYAASTSQVSSEAFGTANAKKPEPTVVAIPAQANSSAAGSAAANPYAGYTASPRLGFFDGVNACLNKYADFKGRARRSEFWWFWLVSFIISSITSSFSNAYNNYGGVFNFIFLLIFGLASLALVVPSIAAAVRRLHDIGKSGWFYLFVLIPIAGPIILLVWFASDGKPEANMYGESPKYTRTF